MNNYKVNISCIPPFLWRKESVQNVDDCNYEIYLTEFINESTEFMKTTDGNNIHHCDIQNKGEWDSYLGEKEFLDFKLLCSQSTQESVGVNYFTLSKNGAYYDYIAPSFLKIVNGGYWINILFKNDSISDLKDIEKGINRGLDKNQFRNKRTVIEKIQTEKDCMFLYTDFFWSLDDISESDIIKAVISFFEKWLPNLLTYRDINKNFKTYLAFMIPQFRKIVFCKWDKNNKSIIFFDAVSFEKSSNFMKYLYLLPPSDKFMRLYIDKNLLIQPS